MVAKSKDRYSSVISVQSSSWKEGDLYLGDE
jgi:hypothetical protein